MSNNIPIKTRAVGGFDKKQVDQYLSSLDEEYEKSVSKEDIAKLREEIAELKISLMILTKATRISPILTISAVLQKNLPTLITRSSVLPIKRANI